MNIVIIQPDIIWESPERNIENYRRLLSAITTDPDLIILPEMFTTGFSMNSSKLAVSVDNPFADWMKSIVKEKTSAITGSLIIMEGGKFYNRLIFIDSKGHISFYDKRHLFRMGGEGDHFTSGNKKLIVELDEWKICPLICYDLRFPVWSRNREEYDLLLYVSNWPAARSEVWNTLLKARAIENQSWVIGVNRVGRDGENIDYKGESQVIDPKGKIRMYLDDQEQVGEISISLSELRNFRKKFPVWKDRDHFTCDW
jgi:predicted amidohydrolase